MSPAFLAPASLRLILAVDPQASGRCSPHASLSPLPSLAAVGAALLLTLAPAGAATMRLPPIDRTVPDSVRCLPKSSAIGQANAARDSLLDLRECDLRSQNLDQFDLSGAILEGAVFDGSTFRDAMLSKAYAPRASFKNCDFSNAVVDRAYFDGSDMTSSDFRNAVLRLVFMRMSPFPPDVSVRSMYSRHF